MENVLADSAPLRLRRPARLLRLTSDERLVALVRDGDEGAFEALYDRHHPAILGFCRHMLGTREEAEDAVQHTFLAAFRDLGGSDKPIDLRPWLFAIARNRCLSLLRARRPHVAIELAEPTTDGLAATVERREDLRELLADLACLPEDQRAALLLAELGALDHSGIAAVLDCPREKVKALVFQARTSLAANREARATPCDEIRLELATASGAALRRGPLRRHLRTCDGCRAFKAEVATQRKLMALALPVVPSVALKASLFSGGGSGASASGGGAAAAATAGVPANGALGGVLGTVASTGAGKVALSLAVAGAVAGGGAFTTAQLEQRRAAHPPSHAASPHAASAAPVAAAPGSASRLPADVAPAAGPGETTPPPAPHPAAADAGAPAVVPSQGGVGAGAGAHTPGTLPAPATGGVRRHGNVTPPVHPTAPPEHSSGKPPSGTPPGQRTKTPPERGRAPPGRSDSPPPGHAKTPPGQSGAATPEKSHPGGGSSGPSSPGGQGSQGQTGGNAGNGGPPADTGAPAHGQSGEAHGQAGAAHGHAG